MSQIWLLSGSSKGNITENLSWATINCESLLWLLRRETKSAKLQEKSLGFSALVAADMVFHSSLSLTENQHERRNLFWSNLESKNIETKSKRRSSLQHNWKPGTCEDLGPLLSVLVHVLPSMKRWSDSLLVKSKETLGKQSGFSVQMKGSKVALVTNITTFSDLLISVDRKKFMQKRINICKNINAVDAS